ncbi:hypothetical protein NS383_02215 [Pseudomonas oryzihabitans]|nr:hypothetical protein NS383_02215 [Pseudomonas psychrotolerans]
MTNLNLQLKNRTEESPWVPEQELPPVQGTSRLHLVPIALVVILAHVALIALILTQTSQKEISLVAAPAAVRVTMSRMPPLPPLPEPVAPVVAPPEPEVMKAKEAERTVTEHKPEVPQHKSVPPKPVPKPKAQPVKKHTPIKPPAEPVPVAEDPPPVKPAPVAPAQPAVADKPLDLPASGPKDVQTVGCRVPTPEYPRKARRLGEQGTVLIAMVIDASGKVQSAQVSRSSGSADLDQAARQAVLNASCEPYRENGRAISVRAAQPINFSLSR